MKIPFLVPPRDSLNRIIRATKGCPAACTFCDIHQTKFPCRSPESVVDEVEQLVKMGVDNLFFVDDTITINKQNLIDTCNLMVERGLKLHYKISARVDTINGEVVKTLKKSGCYRIHFGIESASPRHSKYLQKGKPLRKWNAPAKWSAKRESDFSPT